MAPSPKLLVSAALSLTPCLFGSSNAFVIPSSTGSFAHQSHGGKFNYNKAATSSSSSLLTTTMMVPEPADRGFAVADAPSTTSSSSSAAPSNAAAAAPKKSTNKAATSSSTSTASASKKKDSSSSSSNKVAKTKVLGPPSVVSHRSMMEKQMSLAVPPNLSVGRKPAAAATPAIVSTAKRVYLLSEGNKDMKEVLGGKGANLCEMTRLGLPVPPAFIIATSVCIDYFNEGQNGLPSGLQGEYQSALADVEQKMGKKFGDPRNPLLVSVRSGARASMPGMMDTILNLGMNKQVVEGMIETTGNPRFVYDTYRRFLQMFSDVVMEKDSEPFEHVIESHKAAKGYSLDVEMQAEDWKAVVDEFLKINPDVPSDVNTQLEMAIMAVFKSWFNPRAVKYRQYNNIPEEWGTAVNVQAMVFGNMNDDSGTGVAFSRDPSTGEKKFFGEFLSNAAGEDVVAGIRTPLPLEDMAKKWPDVYNELYTIQRNLENFYKDMQDLEFTIENEKLYMLQTRNGKRTPKAAVKIACDLVDEGMIGQREALLRIPADQMDNFLLPSIDKSAGVTKEAVVAKGLPASPGAVSGTIVFTPNEAEAAAAEGRQVILVRKETTPEDIHGMKSAVGILTALGGMTSHAAVVARGMGRCCVSGCSDITIDMKAETMETAGGKIFKKGDVITLDGSTGEVYDGVVPRIAANNDPNFQRVLDWADEERTLKVFANADTPDSAADATRLGAEGIGLCRTEHMFFETDRITEMRSMILSETAAEKQKHLDRMFEFQREDLKAMLKEMDGLPVTVRLLDPPLHEFLPHTDQDFESLAHTLGKSVQEVREAAANNDEVNPMLGFRGCRLGVVYPEITLMQVNAIVTAASELSKEGYDPRPEIMVPVVSTFKELDYLIPQIKDLAAQVMTKHGITAEQLPIKVGTMMELPRACLTADEIVKRVDFISFGTNDLTQSTFGFSRDDVGRFLPTYLNKGVLSIDPFVSLDQSGVGQLVKIAVEKGTAVKPDVKIGICGEHGGDPASIEFFHNQRLTYVSCSPFRVPAARIAAGQVAAKEAILREEMAAHERELREVYRMIY